MAPRQKKRFRWGPSQIYQSPRSAKYPTFSSNDSTSKLPQIWQNLPTELKVSILAHNLISPSGIKSYRYYHHKCDDDCRTHGQAENIYMNTHDERVTFDQELVLYCLVFPDLAHMLLRIYYTQNTFIIHMPLSLRVQPQFLLPPLHTRSLVREIRWETFLGPPNWEHTQRFAAGEMGFEKLRFVTVYIMWPPFPDCCAHQYLKPENWGQRRKIVFGCKGRLVFQDDEYREESVRTTLAHVGTTKEAIKEWIGGLVQFAE